MKKILFLTQTGVKGPASRYRAYQFLDYLRRNGFYCQVSAAIEDSCFDLFYSQEKPRLLKKLLTVFLKRLKDFNKIKDYDIIFLQREVLPQVYPVIERIIYLMNKKIIFDFDDAIFLIPPQRKSVIYDFRYKNNIKEIIKMSTAVIAGNDYLADYAKQYNQNVYMLPTVVDSDKFDDYKKRYVWKERMIIGWIGSLHTLFYLANIKDVFKKLNRKYKISLHVIGVTNFFIDEVEVINKPWSLETELFDLKQIDIGVAPLLDDEWGRGKCGLKALQYMSGGIPVVCSNAGVYKKIIKDGDNGFLADNEEQWIEKLSILITNTNMRKKMASAARKTIEEKYSLKVNAPKLRLILEKVSSG
ncbi:MAG: glycosyltransferase family 4 protein [Candidatus Omnitrophota bacterium]